jgi:hypothetical protein
MSGIHEAVALKLRGSIQQDELKLTVGLLLMLFLINAVCHTSQVQYSSIME